MRIVLQRVNSAHVDIAGKTVGSIGVGLVILLGVTQADNHEDAELNQRILEAGGRVYMSRDIVAHYYPRDSMGALARQYFQHGQGRARTLVKHRRLRSLRPALPFLGLLGEVILLVGGSWYVGGLSLAAYALATGAEAVRVARSEGPIAIPVVWAIFPVIHASHGAGFAAGLFKYAFQPDWAEPERLIPVNPVPVPGKKL